MTTYHLQVELIAVPNYPKQGFGLGLLGRWGRAEEPRAQRAQTQSLCLLGPRHGPDAPGDLV